MKKHIVLIITLLLTSSATAFAAQRTDYFYATAGMQSPDATFTHIGRITAGDATFTDVDVQSLTGSRCVETDANGKLVSTASTCGSGAGSITQVGNITSGSAAVSSATNATFGNLQATQIGNVSTGDASFMAIAVDTNTLYVNPTNDKVGIGIQPTTTTYGKLVMAGADVNITGPHIWVQTAADSHPVFQQLNWSHDLINQNFDAYWTGVFWISSDAGSNFQLIKYLDKFALNADFGIAAGSPITWDEMLGVTSSATVFNEVGLNRDFRVEGDNDANLIMADADVDRVGIGTAIPTHKLHVDGSITATTATFSSLNSTIIGNSTARDATFTNTTISGLTVSRCVETDSAGKLVSAAGVCAAAGGGDIDQVGNVLSGAAGTSSANNVTFGNLQATQIGNVSVGDASFAGLAADTTTLYVNPNTNFVGVGTIPVTKFDIKGDDNSTILNIAGGTSVGSFQVGADASGDGFAYVKNVSNVATIVLDADSDSYVVTTAGTEFGIGTTTPDAKLDVEAAGPEIRITDTGATGTGFLSFYDGVSLKYQLEMTAQNKLMFDYGAENVMTFMPSGVANQNFVGIGTNAPTRKLHVTGNMTATDATFVTISSTNATFLGIGRTTPGDASFTAIAVDTNTIFVDPVLNSVGIGTSTPSIYKLNIDSGTADSLPFLAIQAAGSDINFYGNAAGLFVGGLGDDFGIRASGDLFLGTNASNDAVIGITQFASNVGIGMGTREATHKLHVNGSITATTATFLSLNSTRIGNTTAADATFSTINSSKIGNAVAADGTFTTVTATNLTTGQCVQSLNGKLVPSGGSCGGVASGDATFTTVQSPKIGNITPGDATFNTVTVLSGGLSTGDATFATITASAATFTGFVKIPKQELFNLSDFTLTTSTSVVFPWTNSPILLTAGKKYKITGAVYLSGAGGGDGVAAAIDGTYEETSGVYHWTVFGDGSPGVLENATTGTSFSELTMTATGILHFDFFVNCSVSGTFEMFLYSGGSTTAEEGSYLTIYEYN